MAEYIYIATLHNNMGRNAKAPITLNSVLIRYLEDIEGEQGARLANENVEPHEMFLVFTLVEGEAYPDQYKEELTAFKRFFTKEKILRFPSLSDFVKKYPAFSKWGDADVMQIIQTGRYTDVIAEKFFVVKVLDFERFKDFRSKYCKVVSQKGAEKILPDMKHPKQKTDFDGVLTLKTEGIRAHTFQEGKNKEPRALRIFKPLWERRRHLIKGEREPLEKGRSLTLRNFAVRAGLMESNTPHSPKLDDKLIGYIDEVIKNMRREGYPFELECDKDSVLLTVKD